MDNHTQTAVEQVHERGVLSKAWNWPSLHRHSACAAE